MQINGFFNNKRLIFTGIITALFALAILISFASLAFSSKTKNAVTLPSVERGQIVDRNGKPLAVQTNFYHLGISPKNISEEQRDDFSRELAEILEISPDEINRKIKENPTSEYILIKKKISQQTYDLVKEFAEKKEYSGIKGDRIPGRVYPENDLAAHLIGYMGDSGEGLSGIEKSQNSILSPSIDPNNPLPLHGKNIYLTIDANLQYKLEKIAKKTLKETKAENVILIASEAKTGEILSLISLPEANLNEYPSSTDAEKHNTLVWDRFEPGSVFKLFSVAAFLDSGAISPDDSFLCDGIYKKTKNLKEPFSITCLDHHGWLNARTALKYSCNDALAQMSEKLEWDPFLEYLEKFGFGEKTGIEIPGETAGFIRKAGDKFFSARTKPDVAIGQEIGVSALQMVQAATAIANYGIPLQLTAIQKITDKDGNIDYIHQKVEKSRVIKSSTAKYILSCMETVALSGTGTRANLGDIPIGVKTGTAQMADLEKGGYSKTDFYSSCMAIFPVENPEIVLYTAIIKPKGETYGGRIAAPVIHEAANEIIDHLGMTRDKAASLEHTGKTSVMENAPLTIGKTVPNLIGRPKRDILPLLGRNDIKFSIEGEGWVVSQNPEPGSPVTENMVIELKFE